MGGRVHGVFMRHAEKHELDYTFCVMLDGWFRDILYKHKKDGKSMLLKILEDKAVGLQYLASENADKAERLKHKKNTQNITNLVWRKIWSP